MVKAKGEGREGKGKRGGRGGDTRRGCRLGYEAVCRSLDGQWPVAICGLHVSRMVANG